MRARRGASGTRSAAAAAAARTPLTLTLTLTLALIHALVFRATSSRALVLPQAHLAKLNATQSSPASYFGADGALDVTDALVLVGARAQTQGVTVQAGGAFLYEATYTPDGRNVSWPLLQALVPPELGAGYQCGRAVRLFNDGGGVLMSCPYRTEFTVSRGAVYSYRRASSAAGAQFVLETRVDGPNVHLSEFGFSVAVNGNSSLLVVGSPGVNAAYVFARAPGNDGWTQQAVLAPSSAGNRFGVSVAVCDRFVAVGDSVTQGTARVFVYTNGGAGGGTTWTLLATLRSGVSFDFFGSALSFNQLARADSAELAVSATGADEFAPVKYGRVYVYVYSSNSSTFNLSATIRPENDTHWRAGNYFGYSLALRGELMAVGSYGYDVCATCAPAVGINAGIGELYYRRENASLYWGRALTQNASDAFTGAYYGSSAALSLKWFAFGGEGVVYIYSAPCVRGTRLDPAGGCSICPQGTYTESTNVAECTSCPRNQSTPATGAGMASDCIGGRIDSVSPALVETTAATVVTIRGLYFGNGWDITSVTLANVTAAVIVEQSITHVVVVAAPAPVSVQRGDVVVTSQHFGVSVLEGAFTYDRAPVFVHGEPQPLSTLVVAWFPFVWQLNGSWFADYDNDALEVRASMRTPNTPMPSWLLQRVQSRLLYGLARGADAIELNITADDGMLQARATAVVTSIHALGIGLGLLCAAAVVPAVFAVVLLARGWRLPRWTTFYDAGDYAEAERLLLTALRFSRSSVGDRSHLIADALRSVASLYHAAGQLQDAEELFYEVLRRQREQLGDRDANVLTTAHCLVDVYLQQGREEEAREVMRDLGIRTATIRKSLVHRVGLVEYKRARTMTRAASKAAAAASASASAPRTPAKASLSGDDDGDALGSHSADDLLADASPLAGDELASPGDDALPGRNKSPSRATTAVTFAGGFGAGSADAAGGADGAEGGAGESAETEEARRMHHTKDMLIELARVTPASPNVADVLHVGIEHAKPSHVGEGAYVPTGKTMEKARAQAYLPIAMRKRLAARTPAPAPSVDLTFDAFQKRAAFDKYNDPEQQAPNTLPWLTMSIEPSRRRCTLL